MYDIRGRIYDELEKFISEEDREKFSRMLEDTENWLYEDGEDCQKQIYLDRLADLKVIGGYFIGFEAMNIAHPVRLFNLISHCTRFDVI